MLLFSVCATMKKQTFLVVLVLALFCSAIATLSQRVEIAAAHAKPTITDVRVSNNDSSPPFPNDICKALHEALQASKPYLLQQMGIYSPNVTILSIAENQTFTTSNITLSFRVTVSVKTVDFAYSLNGQENTTIEGNTTLTELSVGPQSIVVYATDVFGRSGASETVNFTIAQQEEPEFVAVAAEPFPTSIFTAIAGACVALGISSFVIYRKRKR